MAKEYPRKPTFIDLFSGCGGISLGLTDAGFEGLFAIEKAPEAFSTFQANLLDGPGGSRFDWPRWLEQENIDIDAFITKHGDRLQALRGKVNVLAGGPPCQGFSLAGRRNGRDPRNRLFRRYVHFVDAVRPQLLLLENVPGMQIAHGVAQHCNTGTKAGKRASFYDKLIQDLAAIGYVAEGRLLDASSFGVPQRRPRLVVIGVKKTIITTLPGGVAGIFDYIEAGGRAQVKRLGLKVPVSVKDALSDLETACGRTVPYTNADSKRGYSMLEYRGPLTSYQDLMHKTTPGAEMDSMRLARHTAPIARRLALILEECKKGINLSDSDRERYGMTKHRTHAMSPTRPAPTLTTLPDDVVHYSEPRILTVREYARVQSFPDWFRFKGTYTSGGTRRKKGCPRYTQIGNAVPPLLAEAIGRALFTILEQFSKKSLMSAHRIPVGPSHHDELALTI